VQQAGIPHGDGISGVTAVTVSVRGRVWVYVAVMGELIERRRSTKTHSRLRQLDQHWPMLIQCILVESCWTGVLRTTDSGKARQGQKEKAPATCSTALSLSRSTEECGTRCFQHCAACISCIEERDYLKILWCYFMSSINCTVP